MSINRCAWFVFTLASSHGFAPLIGCTPAEAVFSVSVGTTPQKKFVSCCAVLMHAHATQFVSSGSLHSHRKSFSKEPIHKCLDLRNDACCCSELQSKVSRLMQKKNNPTLSVHSVACRGQNDVSFEAWDSLIQSWNDGVGKREVGGIGVVSMPGGSRAPVERPGIFKGPECVGPLRRGWLDNKNPLY